MPVFKDLDRWWVGGDLPPPENAIFERLRALYPDVACACPGPMPGEKMCGCMKWIAELRSAAHAIATGEDEQQRKAGVMQALADQIRSAPLPN